MAPNLLALATTLENLGARRLLAKKVNFVPCNMHNINVTRRVTYEVTPLQVSLTTKASLGRVAQCFCFIYV